MKTIALHTKIRISSPVLDLKQHAKMRLCMEVGGTSITLALFTTENELLYLEEFSLKAGDKPQEALEQLAQTHDLFRHSYANVYVSVASSRYTLVPGALFDNSSREQLLQFNHPLAADELVLSDELFSAETFCVYSVNKRVKELVDKAFPNNHIRHRTVSLIESLPAIASKTHKTCLVHVQGDTMDVALYKNKLLFFNTFSFQADEDFLYFILASLEQNGSPLDETEIVLAGEVEAGSALYNILKKYAPNIRFAVHDKSIVKTNDFVKLPEHFYFSLFNLYLCAL